MLKKDLYLQIYRRFCKEHNLRMRRDAVDDIVSGKRLIFGIGHVYHPEYKHEWYNLTLSLFFQDADYAFEKMKIFRVKEWRMCDMLHALKMGDVTNYFFSVCSCSYSITEFFGFYKEALNQEIKN